MPALEPLHSGTGLFAYVFVCLFVCLFLLSTLLTSVLLHYDALTDTYVVTQVDAMAAVQHPWRCDPQMNLISVLYSIPASLPSSIAALFSYLTDDSICLIPCEFCDKQLSLSQIHSHQVRRVLSCSAVVHPHQISMHATTNCSCSTQHLFPEC